VEEVLDLKFGKCRLMVQVPERGNISDPRELVGKNIVTSFTGLTRRYFARLEAQESESPESLIDGPAEPTGKKLETKIKFVGGSVEAACALGVADGVVDLVGE
jgi:ATP phosphoribosyltransferase